MQPATDPAAEPAPLAPTGAGSALGLVAPFLLPTHVVPALPSVLQFGPPAAEDLLRAALAGALTVVWFELYEVVRPARAQSGGAGRDRCEAEAP